MGSGGPLSLQNWCDPTTSGWVGSIPTRSRHPLPHPPASDANEASKQRINLRACRGTLLRGRHVMSRRRRWGLTALVALLALPVAAAAQVARDTTRPQVVTTIPAVVRVDSTPRAPLSGRRAFLYSLAVPGSAQTILGRPRTAAFFVAVEALSLTMARKSANDLREAKRHARDSLVTAYAVDPVTGLGVVDSTGRPVPAGFLVNDLGARVPARRTHLEDWLAVLAFNHLISGAEAFVSSHLWDLPAQVAVERRSAGTFLTARVRW